ncbi:unnamed protein product [Orchesella dallaii]|uniref:EGF-like domain-containing protein n=1 Tax=Orchesella dallaii TaxID=48710 RepID=A0ABP1PLB0_9HEXA
MQLRNYLVFCALCTITLWGEVNASACMSDDDCDRDRLLVCNSDSHKCECNDNISINDSRKGECALKIWERCNNTKETQHQCISYAECVDDYCKCKPDYFENQRKECERKSSFNGNCTSDDHCQVDRNGYSLPCNYYDGDIRRCACDSYRSIFMGGICLVPAGKDCSEHRGSCVPNSHCELKPSSSYDSVCTCNSDYFRTTLGTCELKRIHGDACNSNADCGTKLICGLDEICECEKPLYVYDPFQASCVLPLGSACDGGMSKNLSQCVTSATCRPEAGNRNLFTCQCDGGKERNGNCLISHGGKCGIENKECNEEEQRTICNEGICACKDGVFDEQKEKCVSGAFGICDYATFDCISNSHCAFDAGSQGGKEPLRKCVCDEGFVPVDYECLATIGQPCNYTKINNDGHSARSAVNCDPIASLRCIHGTCQCGVGEEYDLEMKKCLGLVGSFCEENDEDYCVYHADCVLRSTHFTQRGRCECKLGWEGGKDRKCSELHN